MRIFPINESMIPTAAAFWNECITNELPYNPLSLDDFRKKFFTISSEYTVHCFVCAEDGNETQPLIGFAHGVTKRGTPGYVTMVAVHPSRRQEGIGTALLKQLEEAFISEGHTHAEIIFFNPVNLEWIIPGHESHIHPNTPGVLAESGGHMFFLQHGYDLIAEQNAYHRTLSDFPPAASIPKVASILSTLAQKGIAIEPYRADYHFELDALFDDLHNEHWRVEVKAQMETHPEAPLLVVSDGGKVAGFAGPIYPQPNGRGFFAGIGVHSAYGGMGVGTALFACLCETEQARGASYMTLFTGVTNPARKIYEAAGFTVAACWVDLRKNLKQ